MPPSSAAAALASCASCARAAAAAASSSSSARAAVASRRGAAHHGHARLHQAYRAASSSSSSTAARASDDDVKGKASGGWFSSLFGGGGGGGFGRRRTAHRPYGPNEERHVRLATRKKVKVLQANPGARVEPGFLTVEEGKAAAADAFAMIERHGISHLSDEQRSLLASQMKHFPLPKAELGKLVNMTRVTGRPETDDAAKLAPWGYGDAFDVDQVPAGLRAVLEKIQNSDSFYLGKPRDITINHRTKYFYRLDPHVDPAGDGGNVFILSLLSGTVLTLSPASRTMSAAQFTHMDQRRVSEQSWQPGKDIDVDLPEHALLHICEDARHTWHHGIRLGVTRHQVEDYLGALPGGLVLPEDEAQEARGVAQLFEWFGSMQNVRRRGPERLSIIFAFDDPK